MYRKPQNGSRCYNTVAENVVVCFESQEIDDASGKRPKKFRPTNRAPSTHSIVEDVAFLWRMTQMKLGNGVARKERAEYR
jgi:hypothetical protein